METVKQGKKEKGRAGGGRAECVRWTGGACGARHARKKECASRESRTTRSLRCVAISAISAFPLKSNCCCRAFCAMKMPHCSQRSCTIGRTELPRTATDASVVPLVVATESTALVVPAADKIFEAFREQHTLSVPSRPKTPPPRA